MFCSTQRQLFSFKIVFNKLQLHTSTIISNCIGCDQLAGVEMGSQKIKIPPPLTAQDKSSFAYKTIKDRLPVIIVKTIDFFHRQRKELYKFGGTVEKPNENELQEIESDAKNFITQLTKLRKDVETNKSVSLFEKLNLEPNLDYFNDDIELWNKALESNKLDDNSLPKWFDSPWLLIECYLYRKIKEISLSTKHLKMFDPFVEQKQAACRASLSQMIIVASHLAEVEKITCQAANHSHPSERSEFSLFIQLALWANKSDLSISGMSADKIQQQKMLANIRESLESLQENILCDNMSEIWFKVQSVKDRVRSANQSERPIYIDLVADNAGYEIFADLCLLHFLVLVFCPLSLESSGVRFRIHLKRMPWYVSDAMKHDVDWLLGFLTTSEQDAVLRELGEKWKSFFASNFWEIYQDKFWTLPNDYAEMQPTAEELYETLKQSSLIIFKGDLNYRKLTGDRKWHILTPFRAALRGFTPAPLVALRTAKADVVVGIEDINVFARINNNELPRDWMISGEFGLIQYLDPL